MTNSSDSEFPFIEGDADRKWEPGDAIYELGLSKIEYFSGLALQGLLSNLSALRKDGFKDDEVPEFAAIMAHKLIEQLNK